jgi:syntaxin-binding protein 5
LVFARIRRVSDAHFLGEYLQGLDRKTAEMQEGAANFASMASELEKKMAGRKWWQI